jgi:hypothetical protein
LAPLASLSLAGQEHGRTIPLTDIANFCEREETSTRRASLPLPPGLDSPEQPEAHLAVIARERDHETHPPVA